MTYFTEPIYLGRGTTYGKEIEGVSELKTLGALQHLAGRFADVYNDTLREVENNKSSHSDGTLRMVMCHQLKHQTLELVAFGIICGDPGRIWIHSQKTEGQEITVQFHNHAIHYIDIKDKPGGTLFVTNHTPGILMQVMNCKKVSDTHQQFLIWKLSHPGINGYHFGNNYDYKYSYYYYRRADYERPAKV